MLVLGIILLLVVVGVFVAVLVGGAGQPAVDLGAFHVQTSTFGVFLIGAAAVVLLVVGLWLVLAGLRRANRRRQDKKELNRLTQKLEAHEERGTAETTTLPAETTTLPAETRDTTGSAETAPGPGTTEPRGDAPVTEQDRPNP